MLRNLPKNSAFGRNSDFKIKKNHHVSKNISLFRNKGLKLAYKNLWKRIWFNHTFFIQDIVYIDVFPKTFYLLLYYISFKKGNFKICGIKFHSDERHVIDIFPLFNSFEIKIIYYHFYLLVIYVIFYLLPSSFYYFLCKL